MGRQVVGKVGWTHQTCRWIMGTNLLHQGDVLGLIALGCHWVMSTLMIESVMT